MNAGERVRAALRGESVDRPPIALWRHFPDDDQTPDGFARAVLDWQARHGWDLVKITPSSGYSYEDWGAQFRYVPNDDGTRQVLHRPVVESSDWARVQPLDIHAGVLRREVQATRLITDQLNGDRTPSLQTVFSPSYTAARLAADGRFVEDVRERPAVVRPALEAVTATTITLSRAFLEAGATGIFFATQLARRQELSEDEYRAFAEPYDRAVLEAIRDRAEIVMLHIHGVDVYVDALSGYPVDAINWEARRTPPSLADAQHRFGGCLAGGLDETTLLRGTPDEVASQVRSAVEETGGRRLIVAAGCATPITAPEANLRAARRALDSFA